MALPCSCFGDGAVFLGAEAGDADLRGRQDGAAGALYATVCVLSGDLQRADEARTDALGTVAKAQGSRAWGAGLRRSEGSMCLL